MHFDSILSASGACGGLGGQNVGGKFFKPFFCLGLVIFFCSNVINFFLKMNEFTVDIYREILRLLFFITNWTEPYTYMNIYIKDC